MFVLVRCLRRRKWRRENMIPHPGVGRANAVGCTAGRLREWHGVVQDHRELCVIFIGTGKLHLQFR